MNCDLISELFYNYLSSIEKLKLRLLNKSHNEFYDKPNIWNDILQEKYSITMKDPKGIFELISNYSFPITKAKIKCLERFLISSTVKCNREGKLIISEIDKLIKFKTKGLECELVYISKDRKIKIYNINIIFHDSFHMNSTIKIEESFDFKFEFSYHKNIDHDSKFRYFNEEEWKFGMKHFNFEFYYPQSPEDIRDLIQNHYKIHRKFRYRLTPQTKHYLFYENFKIAKLCYKNKAHYPVIIQPDNKYNGYSIIIQTNNNKYLHFCTFHRWLFNGGDIYFLYEYDSIENLLNYIAGLNDPDIAESLLE